jgi:hypothetical protein
MDHVKSDLISQEEWLLIDDLLKGEEPDFIFNEDFLKTISLLPKECKTKEGIESLISLFKALSEKEAHVVFREVLKTPFKERMNLLLNFQRIYTGQYLPSYEFVEHYIQDMAKRLQKALSSGLKSDYWFQYHLEKSIRDEAFELIPKAERNQDMVTCLENWFEGTDSAKELLEELKKIPLEERSDVLFKTCALFGEEADLITKISALRAVFSVKERDQVFSTYQKFFGNFSGIQAVYLFRAIAFIPEEKRTEELMTTFKIDS